MVRMIRRTPAALDGIGDVATPVEHPEGFGSTGQAG